LRKIDKLTKNISIFYETGHGKATPLKKQGLSENPKALWQQLHSLYTCVTNSRRIPPEETRRSSPYDRACLQ